MSTPARFADAAAINPNVRLIAEDQRALYAAAQRLLPASARVFLFGSRTRFDRRGGDVDLLVEQPDCVDEYRASITLGAAFEHALDRSVDVTVTRCLETDTRPFVRAIRPSLVQLWPAPQ